MRIIGFLSACVFSAFLELQIFRPKYKIDNNQK